MIPTAQRAPVDHRLVYDGGLSLAEWAPDRLPRLAPDGPAERRPWQPPGARLVRPGIPTSGSGCRRLEQRHLTHKRRAASRPFCPRMAASHLQLDTRPEGTQLRHLSDQHRWDGPRARDRSPRVRWLPHVQPGRHATRLRVEPGRCPPGRHQHLHRRLGRRSSGHGSTREQSDKLSQRGLLPAGFSPPLAHVLYLADARSRPAPGVVPASAAADYIAREFRRLGRLPAAIPERSFRRVACSVVNPHAPQGSGRT